MANAAARLLSGLLAILPAAPAQAADTVRACINSNNYVAAIVLARAEDTATRIMATAGVALEWHTMAPALCRAPYQERSIVIDFIEPSSDLLRPDILAYAHLDGAPHVVVLYDRFSATVGVRSRSVLLGHVMAHEITHILQGISRHSPSGLMKAHWSAADLRQMMSTPLPFGPQDVGLIQLGLHPHPEGEANREEVGQAFSLRTRFSGSSRAGRPPRGAHKPSTPAGRLYRLFK